MHGTAEPDRTAEDLQAEVEDLTGQLVQTREFLNLYITDKLAMSARCDRVIAEMRVEVDAANLLWRDHLAQWENQSADKWMNTWRKVVVLSTFAILALALLAAVSGR